MQLNAAQCHVTRRFLEMKGSLRRIDQSVAGRPIPMEWIDWTRCSIPSEPFLVLMLSTKFNGCPGMQRLVGLIAKNSCS